jgi:hypothetical protein
MLLWKWWQGEQEQEPLFDVDIIKSKTILKTNGRYSGLYSNQTDPRNKVGGVAWLLLKLDKENLKTIQKKEIGGKNINI